MSVFESDKTISEELKGPPLERGGGGSSAVVPADTFHLLPDRPCVAQKEQTANWAAPVGLSELEPPANKWKKGEGEKKKC